MPETFSVPLPAIRPSEAQVLEGPGFSGRKEPDTRLKAMFVEAAKMFNELARPQAVIAAISVPEFRAIYSNPVQDLVPTPVAAVFPKAEFIYLFAVTIGAGISVRVNDLFEKHDFALGYLLDALASAGAENAAAYILNNIFDLPVKEKPADRTARVLDYNPGYCGWHMSGQRKLLDYLEADRIGIKLNESYLMQPLKSLSGALIGGRAAIHEFDADFPFCAGCVSRACRDRIDRVREK